MMTHCKESDKKFFVQQSTKGEEDDDGSDDPSRVLVNAVLLAQGMFGDVVIMRDVILVLLSIP